MIFTPAFTIINRMVQAIIRIERVSFTRNHFELGYGTTWFAPFQTAAEAT
ncbi:hypothetical protein [Desulfobulbus oligotrophicus]|uniref:Uncharacterized protein n=1 Tax=Desulfobulbus oligotrophicus TaxID=1909699 RepID=A0A7T5VCN7_9BACT|nr:hypothetical protein [Desulfobulbus oligotrophicus]QQG65444.1 hypothetical protein HP555_05975 [Desulfobulbus oligotrophicus]